MTCLQALKNNKGVLFDHYHTSANVRNLQSSLLTLEWSKVVHFPRFYSVTPSTARRATKASSLAHRSITQIWSFRTTSLCSVIPQPPSRQYSTESLRICNQNNHTVDCESGPQNQHEQIESLLGLRNPTCPPIFHQQRANWKCAINRKPGIDSVAQRASDKPSYEDNQQCQ